MSSICGPVDLFGMFGCCPGLIGGLKGIGDSVLCASSLIVRAKYPSCPLPRLEWTYAALVFSLR